MSTTRIFPPLLLFGLLLGLFASAAPQAAEDIDFGQYYALIVGNNEYRHLQPLKNARRDAEVLSDVLKNQYGFQVTQLLDAEREDIITALDKFRLTLEEGDNFLLYYAGHGWEDEGADEGYWLPVDAAENKTVNWISVATITTKLRALAAKHILVVSDSCYSGKLTRGVKPILDNKLNYIRKMASKKARTVMTSGGLEPVLDAGGKWGLSIFATAFMEALAERDESVIDTSTLFPEIRRKVMTAANQTPEYADIRKAGHDGGDFLFVRRAKFSISDIVGKITEPVLGLADNVNTNGGRGSKVTEEPEPSKDVTPLRDTGWKIAIGAVAGAVIIVILIMVVIRLRKGKGIRSTKVEPSKSPESVSPEVGALIQEKQSQWEALQKEIPKMKLDLANTPVNERTALDQRIREKQSQQKKLESELADLERKLGDG